QPSHTVAAVSEKHITANQSSELTTARRSVGSEKAASTAVGTAIKAYSGSKTSAKKHIVSNGHAMNINGTQIWGDASQARQLHSASSAKGQVGQRNQGRSRNRLSRTSVWGRPNEWLFHNHQFCAQYGACIFRGIHQ